MKIECSLENAPRFADWIKNRGGIAHWTCADLSNAGKTWSSPALDRCPDYLERNKGVTGQLAIPCGPVCLKCKGTNWVQHPKEHWSMNDKPEIVTDPQDVTVYESKEVARVKVSLRRSGFGLSLTDASQRRLEAACKKAGPNSFYVRGGLDFPEMLVFASKDVGTLKEWMEKNP